MFNTINPINIVYRKPQESPYAKQKSTQEGENTSFEGQKNGAWQEAQNDRRAQINQDASNMQSTRPSNRINIAQILSDFRKTTSAINAPSEISDDVEVYLGLVEKESKKENPSRDIVLSNLKNASRISDKYIADTLKKPSKVVEGWVDALFLQSVDIKSDPEFVNEIFKIQFPEKKTDKKVEEKTPDTPVEIEETKNEAKDKKSAKYSKNEAEDSKIYYKNAQLELKAAFQEARKMAQDDPVKALVVFQDALAMANGENNENFKPAIHFERAKIFDTYDYINNALSEYNKATKTPDNNLKSQAHLKMAKIYDSYVKDEVAAEHYSKAITFSGIANNAKGQASCVNSLSGFYAKRFDKENTLIFSDLAIDCAKESEDLKTIGKTYSGCAKNFEYIGEDEKAMKAYKMAANAYNKNESYKEIAKNYEAASKLMRKMGNEAKANVLLSKAKQYEMM